MSRRVLCKIAAAVAVAGSLALSTVATASAAGLAPTPAGAADTASRGGGGGVTPNEQLPAEIQVLPKENLKIVATFRGEGVQVYRSCNTDGSFAAEPVATLKDLRSREVVGIHGAGPFWASLDGSKVTRNQAIAVVAARPKNISPADVDWLRVAVTSSPVPRGLLNNVTVVQRIDTRGGRPQGTCATTTLPISIPYSTNYVFWAPK
jgi:hypothetical protein